MQKFLSHHHLDRLLRHPTIDFNSHPDRPTDHSRTDYGCADYGCADYGYTDFGCPN